MYKIEYAALKYYNNVLTDECLYIGMLFHNLTTGSVISGTSPALTDSKDSMMKQILTLLRHT